MGRGYLFNKKTLVMYSLIDCNNFYASCERVFNPALQNKPIVVLSNNDGCVIARSNEAKKIGIPMGAVAFKYQHIFRNHDVQVFSANFPLYGDMSNRVMTILSGYSPVSEIYSIDECFLLLEGIDVNFYEYGLDMVQKVKKWTGISISVGTAPTKVLAKVANRIAKKYPQITNNSYVIDNEEKRIKALKWLPVEDVWGIGSQTAKKLYVQGIKTAYDFTQLPESWVLKNMTIVGVRLQRDLKGIPTIDLEEKEKRKNISTSRSFDGDISSYADLKERLIAYTTLAAENLRAQHSLCNKINLFVETNRFKETETYYYRSIQLKLPFATSSTIELVGFVVKGLKQIYQPNLHYKKAGVLLSKLVDADCYQPSLFYNSDVRHKKLMQVIDNINTTNCNAVRIAGMDKDRFKMRQEYLSPAYTTNINEVVEVYL